MKRVEQQRICRAIMHYARERGLRNVRMECLFGDFWRLFGDGQPGNVWPLVWFVADELGIDWGRCGPDYQDVDLRCF